MQLHDVTLFGKDKEAALVLVTNATADSYQNLPFSPGSISGSFSAEIMPDLVWGKGFNKEQEIRFSVTNVQQKETGLWSFEGIGDLFEDPTGSSYTLCVVIEKDDQVFCLPTTEFFINDGSEDEIRVELVLQSKSDPDTEIGKETLKELMLFLEKHSSFQISFLWQDVIINSFEAWMTGTEVHAWAKMSEVVMSLLMKI